MAARVGDDSGATLHALEFFPVQIQLTHDLAERPGFQVFASPIGHGDDAPAGRVVPFPVRAAAASRDLLAAEPAQFSRDFLILHVDLTGTSVSAHSGEA